VARSSLAEVVERSFHPPVRRAPTGDTRNGRKRTWLGRLISLGGVAEEDIREGRFQRALALIAGASSILSGLEVITEHYRGSYSQQVMYTPVLLSPALLVAGVWGAFSRRAARTVLPLVSLVSIANGIVGFVFHVRGIQRKPGGWRVPIFNLIMGPPVFAPVLFALSGYLGLIASFLRRADDPPRNSASAGKVQSLPEFAPGKLGHAITAEERRIHEGRLQKHLAVAAGVSAMMSGFEALYSHYKNNFRYKAQWTPILLSPLLLVAGIAAVFSQRIARTALPLLSLLAALDGVVGTFYHVRGILRRPGGLRYPLYNLMYGPPPFAPLLFAASGFLGLLASLVRRSK
jgi:hypothetical protein